MPDQKTYAPNSILDVKQYMVHDFNGGFVLSDSRFVKIIPKLGFKHQLCIFHTKKV